MDDFELRPAGRERGRFTVSGAAGDTLEWTITGEDDPVARTAAGAPRPAAQVAAEARALTAPFRGPGGAARADAVRRDLDAALERWWRDQELLPDDLLRDGLLLLEAGHTLHETLLTLLARSALARGRGVVTALRWQGDAARTAGLVREALLDGALDPAALGALRSEPALGERWLALLRADLRADRYTPNQAAAARAAAALAALDAPLAALQAAPGAPAGDEQSLLAEPPAPRSRAAWAGVAVLLLAAAGVVWLWWGRPQAGNRMIAVPAGTYTVAADADGAFSGQIGARRVTLDAYSIDRTEVTNAQYRDCYGAGACRWPAGRDSATRRDYFLDAAYAQHPVLNVTWAHAQEYCAWQGKRLPSEAEWEVAATLAPATARHYRYPWGETWQPELVIGGGGFVDTAAVGSRSPQGDSPLGAADMAGNVSEWTASVPTSHPELAMIRGGSWRDSPERLLPTSLRLVRKDEANEVIGFRCARATPS